MKNLSKIEIANAGIASIEKDSNKTYIKEVTKLSNSLMDLKIINTKVEENVYLNIVDCLVKEDYTYELDKGNKHLQIRVILQGEFYKIKPLSNEKNTYRENHIIIEYNQDEKKSLVNKKGQHLKYLCITLEEKYLNENPFLYDILEKSSNNNLQIEIFEPQLKNRYKELFSREYSSMVDKIYLKNKTMDLIFFVIDKLENKKKTFEYLNNEDFLRIKEVKKIIEKSFNEKLTIPLLSKEVAVNQSKLKKGFKDLFGHTIHEYLKNIRLEKAIEYLQSKKYSVKEVAIMVGYTNQGSFSYAFSQKYNCSPKDIIKNS